MPVGQILGPIHSKTSTHSSGSETRWMRMLLLANGLSNVLFYFEMCPKDPPGVCFFPFRIQEKVKLR